MPDPSDDESAPAQPLEPHELSEVVGARERRKARTRNASDRTLWMGVGMFGVIGWSIAVPTLIGAALGLWLDRKRPGSFSWTLALLLAGVTLGCLSAWYWISQERKAIEEEEMKVKK